MPRIRRKLTYFVFLAILLVYIISSFNLVKESSALSASQQDVIITGDVDLSRSGASTYGTAPWEIDSAMLRTLTGGKMDYGGFSEAIENYFIPMGVRLVMLWMDWKNRANTTTQDIQYLTWVDAWLKACDRYGVANVFMMRQWGVTYRGASWDADVYRQFPDLQTFDRNGQPIDPITAGGRPWYTPDDPRVAAQYKEDLEQLWEYYGHHPSWIGFGTHYGDYAHYTATDTKCKDVGFSNFTVKNFANSIYYLRDVNGTGFHQDGTKCKIWEMFVENKPPTVLGWGVRQDSDPLDVYGGTGLNGSVVAFKVKAPCNLDGFKIVWYGRKVGSPPASLTVELYQNKGPYEALVGDEPLNLGSPIETAVSPDVGIIATWQSAVSFTAKLIKESYYWLVFQTSGGDANNKYQIYRRGYKVDESTAKQSINGYGGYWGRKGSIILKLKDANGNDKKTYPFQARIWMNDQVFTPESDITFNTVFIQLSDRTYDEADSIVQIIRVSDNVVLASGILDQANLKGIPGVTSLCPVKLDKRITCSAGVQYRIRLVNRGAFAWAWSGVETNPASEGFQNQSRTAIFRLADMDIALENFMHAGPINAGGVEGRKPGVTDSCWYAVRFKPSISASLSWVAVKIYSKYGTPADFQVSLYNGTSTQPVTEELEYKVVPSSDVPNRGWINATGWTYSLIADNYYWIVFKTIGAAADSGYRICVSTNPYQLRPAFSEDGGRTWVTAWDPVDESIVHIGTSSEEWRVEPEERLIIEQVSDTKWIAQSFSSPTDMRLRGIILNFGRSRVDKGSVLTVQLRTDDSDVPSSSVLASGKIGYSELSYEGLYYVDFGFPCDITAGTKYWLVIKSEKDSSIYFSTYVFKVPSNSYAGITYKVKLSTNSGSNWSLPLGKEADIIFGLAKEVVPSKVYNTTLISQDIENYHCYKITDEPLHGWNTYLNIQTSIILEDIVTWFERYTDKKWVIMEEVNTPTMAQIAGTFKHSYRFPNIPGPIGSPPSGNFFMYDTIHTISGWEGIMKSSGISAFPWGSWGNPGDNTGSLTPEQIGVYYRVTVPLCARAISIFDVSAEKWMDMSHQRWSRAYGDILNRMRYYGGWYGNEKGVINALFIGDLEVGIVPQFLTPALNITLCGFAEIKGDYNLTRLGDFKQFDVIVWISGRPSMDQISTNAQERIKRFVSDGGGFVTLVGWAGWAKEIFGDGAGGEGTALPTTHVIWKPYEDADFIDSRPHICERTYGSGRSIHLGLKTDFGRMGMFPGYTGFGYGAPRDSMLVLINNAVFYAAKKESMIPTWWYSTYKDYHSWHNQLYYSISGKPGSPILLWLSNNDTATSFEIHLNATFYGLDPNGWIAINIFDWSVVSWGTGTDVKIDYTVSSMSWAPIYIMNATSNLQDLHSKTFYKSQSLSTKETTYMFQESNQISWLTLNIASTLCRFQTRLGDLLLYFGWVAPRVFQEQLRLRQVRSLRGIIKKLQLRSFGY